MRLAFRCRPRREQPYDDVTEFPTIMSNIADIFVRRNDPVASPLSRDCIAIARTNANAQTKYQIVSAHFSRFRRSNFLRLARKGPDDNRYSRLETRRRNPLLSGGDRFRESRSRGSRAAKRKKGRNTRGRKTSRRTREE